MQARFGEGCLLVLFNKKIIDSIRLVPGSNPGQPTVIARFNMDLFIFIFYLLFSHSHFQKIGIDRDRYWLTRVSKVCYTVE